MYGKLVEIVNNNDTSRFILKTKYDVDKSELEKNNPDTSGLAKQLDYNANFTKIESKIPIISGLAIISALTAVENKKPDVSSLVKKKNRLKDRN